MIPKGFYCNDLIFKKLFFVKCPIQKLWHENQVNELIPYSGYFSRGNIFVKVVILVISWKKFHGRAVCIKTTPILSYTRGSRFNSRLFVGKYFVVRLSTTKTTKILPPRKIPAIRYAANMQISIGLPEPQSA